MSKSTQEMTPAELVRVEAAALLQLAARLDGRQRETFSRVADLLVDTVKKGRRVVVCGVGKSGLIGRKVAATLLSLGTPACFMHPTEALHGDLGMLGRGDVLLAISYSGETEEVLRLLPILPKIGAILVSFCGRMNSTLASASSLVLDVHVEREACDHQLAPTSSTTVMVALGDALAIEVSRRLDFQPRDFAELHPGGQLGRRLSTVRQLMHTGDALPTVSPNTEMPQLLLEMSTKRLGMTTVQSNGKLLGVLSDGDLRRLLERNGPHAFHKKASDVMNASPRTIPPGMLATEALALMEQYKITALVVTEDGTKNTAPLGLVHLHDLWEVAPPPPATEKAAGPPSGVHEHWYPLEDTDDGRL